MQHLHSTRPPKGYKNLAVAADFAAQTAMVRIRFANEPTPTMRADSHADALAFYERLREANRAMRCDFFEGVVMKRADSTYPVQLRSAAKEFRWWVKHRFLI